jgi:hypothetical protein
MKAAECTHPVSKVSVAGLAEGKEYEFRVIALNKGGQSEPSEASKPQLAKSRFVAPRIDKTSLKNVTVKAGQMVNLEAQFLAEPEPSYLWSSEKINEILLPNSIIELKKLFIREIPNEINKDI